MEVNIPEGKITILLHGSKYFPQSKAIHNMNELTFQMSSISFFAISGLEQQNGLSGVVFNTRHASERSVLIDDN